GTRTLLVEPGALQRSSLYSYDPASKSHNAGATIAREVPVTTLDTLLRNHAWQAPFGLKMDVQGAELEIIRGGARFLEQTEFVIPRSQVLGRSPGASPFGDFFAAWERGGFRVCFFRTTVRPPSTEVKFLDLVFGKKAK